MIPLFIPQTTLYIAKVVSKLATRSNLREASETARLAPSPDETLAWQGCFGPESAEDAPRRQLGSVEAHTRRYVYFHNSGCHQILHL